MTDLLLVLAGAVTGLVVGAVFAARRRSAETADELARSREEVSRRLAEVFALQELSYTLSESLQPTRIAEQVIAYLQRFTDVEGAMVALTAEGGRTLRVAAAAGPLAGLRGRELDEHDGGLLMDALGHEQLVHRAEQAGVRPSVAAGITARRAAALPLRAHGVTIGAVAVAEPRHGTFEQDALRLLSTVATHAAIVLSNARFFDLVRSGRDQWETTFNALTEGLAVIDEGGRIRRANRALATLVGASTSTLSGREFASMLVPASAELRTMLDAARQATAPPPVTMAATGGRRLRVAATHMRGDEGASWLVVLVKDVTEQETMESQLIQNEKMAAVGQLVSGVAHELNNPLTSIAGLAELLLEQPAQGSGGREHVRVIREQADRAGRIVRNLLTFARKGPAETEPFNLNEIVERSVALVGYELKLREIRIETALDRTLPPTVGDRYQIQQVVLNLVTNAIHAVRDNPPDRPRHVRIATSTGGDMLTLQVEDTGPGIPDDLLPQIFTPFFTTKAPGQGTGLGLSLSYRILEGHGGSLSVESRPGGGAVFVMRLPITDAPAATAAAPVAVEPTAAAATQDVLVVDEDPAVRRMLSVLLAEGGRRVDAAADATQATAHLAARAYQLVVADARVPVSAGERFADYLLRTWPERRPRPIFLTADVRSDTEAWLRGLGAPFFYKPFKVAELKVAIAEVLSGEAPASGGPAGPAEHGLQPG